MSDCVCVVVGVCVGGGGGLKKSLRFGLVQILGLVTHWCEALGAQTGPTSSLSAGPGHRARATSRYIRTKQNTIAKYKSF